MKIPFITVFIISLIFSNSLLAENTEKIVTKWLVLDPVEIKLPVMSSSKDDLKDILKFSHLTVSELWPAENDRVEWEKDTYLEWQQVSDQQGRLVIKPVKNAKAPQVAYAAFYIHSDRWLHLAQ